MPRRGGGGGRGPGAGERAGSRSSSSTPGGMYRLSRGGGSIGPGGTLASSLREVVPDKGVVSVEDNAHPHGGHHDATLYQREGGKFREVDKAHVDNG